MRELVLTSLCSCQICHMTRDMLKEDSCGSTVENTLEREEGGEMENGSEATVTVK